MKGMIQMANAKGSKSTQSRNKKRKNKMDFKLIGTIVFSILLAVLLYTDSGLLGKTLNETLGGMLGILRYVLPLGTFAIAMKMACKKEEEYITQKLFQYAVLLIFIAVIMSIYQISKGSLDITGDISQILKRAYTLRFKRHRRRRYWNTCSSAKCKVTWNIRSSCFKCRCCNNIICFCV